MIYSVYSIGGEIYHSATGKVYKYIDKVRTKSGKWRYIYQRNKALQTKRKFETDAYNTSNRYLDNILQKKAQNGGYTKKDEQMYKKKKNKFNNITNVYATSKQSNESIESRIEGDKESIKVLRDKMNKSTDKASKESYRELLDKYEKDLYILEKERQNRQGNIKLGRQR